MGQYHSVINLDKHAGYAPKSLGVLSKIAEQGESYATCAALLLLLSNPDGWGGERIAIVGDYAEDTDIEHAPFPASELWHRLDESDGIKNVGWLARKTIEQAGVGTFDTTTHKSTLLDGNVKHHTAYGFNPVDPTSDPLAPAITVYNHDKHERITPTLLGDPTTLLGVIREGWLGGTGTALTILLAASCKGGARGGGDYDGQHPLVGSWAGDRISVAADADGPSGYVDVTATLRDEVMEHQVWGVHYEADEKGRITRALEN